jgi:hypothetical protein
MSSPIAKIFTSQMKRPPERFFLKRSLTSKGLEDAVQVHWKIRENLDQAWPRQSDTKTARLNTTIPKGPCDGSVMRGELDGAVTREQPNLLRASFLRRKINEQDVRIIPRPVEYNAATISDIEGPHYGGIVQPSQLT